MLLKNKVRCPVLPGIVVCPEWNNNIIKAGINSYCAHPTCGGYLGKGGAIYVANGKSFLAQQTKFSENTDTSGGAIYAEDTAVFTANFSSSFESNGCPEPDLGHGVVGTDTSSTPYISNGGAVYFKITKFLNLVVIGQPLFESVYLYNNFVSRGTGGVVYWEVPSNMFHQVRQLGGLVRFVGYDLLVQGTSNPLARGNVALWGGDFVASGPFQLVTIDGPAKFAGATSDTSVTCNNVASTGVCPYHCSGQATSGQQCVTRANQETFVSPMEAKSGVAIGSDLERPGLKVAVLDFYNNIYESAVEPIYVQAFVSFKEHFRTYGVDF